MLERKFGARSNGWDGRDLAVSGVTAFETETVESCRSLGIERTSAPPPPVSPGWVRLNRANR